mgnify:CR=1 FL=1
MSKKLYKVLKPIGYGGRQEKGAVIEIDEAYAKAIGSEYVVEADKGEVATDTTVVEKPVDKMSLAELKDKAKQLKLPATGSKADLIERINLASK